MKSAHGMLWLAAWLLSCTSPKAAPQAGHAQRAPDRRSLGRAPSVEVLAVRDDTPEGGDGAPRLRLAFRFEDGTRKPIDLEATAYVPFRRGVALVDPQRRLVLASPDGARSVLALEAGAPPARGPAGELVYVARHDLVAEVHVLDTGGRDRIVATDLGNAGLLAPQSDGRLFFVATPRGGGVAGLWLTNLARGPARCLTNCELTTGTPLGDRHVPLPRSADAIHPSATQVAWDAADGTRRSVALLPRVSGPTDGVVDGEDQGDAR